MTRALVAAALLAAACDGEPSVAGEVTPGAAVGAIAIGDRWSDVRDALGEPPADPVVLTRVGLAQWPAHGVEVLLASPDEAALADDAIVLAVAALPGAAVAGPLRPGSDRAAIEAALGAPPETIDGRALYPAGVVVEYGADDVVDALAVVPPYTLAPAPPPMLPASTTAPRPSDPRTPSAGAGVVIDGRTIPVIDMHLHAGDIGAMATGGKAFITGSLPPFLRRYAPVLLDTLSDPYAPHLGIAAQTTLAGIGHAVVYAVYTPRSTGHFSNEALEVALTDPRNVAEDGLPWAWGFVSLDLDGWSDDVAGARLEALRSYLRQRPDLFLGIKLAHAHQGVALGDAAYHGVFQVAAEEGVPVLLHTGLSPFPGTETDPAFYDPIELEALITAYDGEHGQGRVDFVLSHVGQGDARAVEHALALAEAHANVWLELSALGRPTLVGLDGEPVESTDPQYPAVLDALRERNLVDRALFASDGPQSSGSVRSYLDRIVTGMVDAGYSVDQIAGVLSGNFARLYLDGK